MMKLSSLPIAAAAAMALSACGERESENVEAGPAAANEAPALQAPEPAALDEAATAPAEEAAAPEARSRPDRERTPALPPPPPPAPRAEEPVVDPHAGHDMNDMADD